ncbi:hypothetical protein HU175_01990 [Spirosoma sp. KUDC1026]|nr:hypothetical protein HU175_01990 [Spirosoma sp. KUDC1026]
MSVLAHARPSADSLVIQFANRTRMVIYAPDKNGIKSLSAYDLNKIVRDMGMKLDTLPDGKTAVSLNEQEGEKYIKDTVLIVTRRKGDISVVIRDSEKVDTDSVKHKAEYQKATSNRQRSRKSDRQRVSFEGLGIGLTNLVQRSSLPAYPEDSYKLKPIGSRYIALAFGSMPTIAGGKHVSLKLYYGLEVAWNNFMFEENVIPEKTPAGIVFTPAGRELSKSKLTVCTLGIPIVPRLTFYNDNGRKLGHFGVGVYGNYRLDSYRKIKEEDGGVDRRHSDFGLKDLRYGLIAHIGIRRTGFFVKYDLSPLFEPGQGPDVRAISFGLSL